jgi:hypothetical protein
MTMFETWCSSISSQFHVSWEQLEIIVILGISVAFGYLLLRILDVILFGQMAVNRHYLEEGGDQSSYDYVHIRHDAHDIISEEEISNAGKDFHFNMPQHVREEQEDNLETIIGSTSSSPPTRADVNDDDVPSYSSSSSTQRNNTVGLRKRNPLQVESAANREISVVEGEEGYILVSKK